ncbi:MAG: trypsin-like peptidase domain-containing protein, partial [Planctomycetes bacterium]|nr:trypsin-like peptidase domain-containing protein [Planctomycetota bacterium]
MRNVRCVGGLLLTVVMVGLAFTAAPASAQMQAGEHISVNIDTPHGYKGTLRGEPVLRWRYELTHPGATYIAIHFTDFDLGPGDYLRVADPWGEQEYFMQGRGKMEAGTFWAQHIKGETAVLELVTVSREGGLGFGIDEYVAGFVDLAPPGDEHQERAICPPDDKENAICYELSHPVEYDRGRAVARLLINGSGLCTGWLASAQDHLVTNEHCIGSASSALNTDYEFMAEATTCASGNCQLCYPGVVFSGATLIRLSANLDYALVQINSGNPAATFGFLEIDDRAAIPGEQIYIPQHPGGRAKEFAIFSTHPSDVGGVARVNSITAPACNGTGFFDVGYFADTEGGSSGSPVIASSSNRVIALHHCANCPNRGVPIHLVCAEICDFFGPGPAGTIVLDKGLYGCDDVVAIELRDGDLADTGTHPVTVDSSGGDSETVVLTETGPGTAVFQGSIPTSTTAGPGVLEVAHGDTVTVTYIDADDGQGNFNVVVTATALVDCVPPNILSVQTTTVLPRSAVVTINADEPVRGTVYYGLSCASLTDSATGSGFATSATVNVGSLQDNQTYFYSVEATDQAGNSAADDNSGNCYSFTTPEFTLPFFDDFPTTTFDPFKWALVSNADIDSSGLNPPSAPFSARFNGNPNGGDEIQTFPFDLSGFVGVQLEYAWQRTGGGEHPDAGDDLYIEYADAGGAWQVLNLHLGGGTDMTTFQAESLELPGDALHSNFRLRIR